MAPPEIELPDGVLLRHAEPVMGTVVSFAIPFSERTRAAIGPAVDAACRVLHEADAVFSTWKPDSPMSRHRRGELALEDGPPAIAEVLDACESARTWSGGWFDPWALPGGVDPTGLVKGWAAERAAAELRAGGIASAMIDAGGDVVTFGRPEPGRAWLIGVRDPRRPSRLACVVPSDGALATSAHYERPGQVIAPPGRAPARELLSATVAGPDLALADALATGLLAAGTAGLEPIAALERYHAYAITSRGVVRVTAGFPSTFRTPRARP